MAAAGLLDLPDELHGLIYERLDSADSKRAFRHSCSLLHRSRAINDHLTSLSITSSDHFVACVAAFPRYATLRRLEVSTCLNLGRCLELIFQEEENTAARHHLRNVHHLLLKGCYVEGASLGSCLAVFKLQRLDVAQLDCVGDELILQLAGATSLKHLTIEHVRYDGAQVVLDVAPLKALKKLNTLELYNFKPVNFNEPLAALPELETLKVGELDGYQDEEEPWSSKTVKHMFVRTVSVDAKAISMEGFPALQTFQFGGINFLCDYFYRPGEMEVHMELVKGMASWLSALPVKAAHCGNNFVQNGKAAFCLSRLIELSGPHASACIQALSSSPPIKRALSEVKVLLASDFECSPESLSALTELFCDVEEFTLSGIISRGLPLSLGPLLLLCMRGLPRLWYWHIDLCGIGEAGIHEIIVPLIEARETRSRFELHVAEEAETDEYTALEVVAAQWAKVTSLLPRGPPVTLAIMPA